MLFRTPSFLTWSLPAPQTMSLPASLRFRLLSSLIPAASGLFTASFCFFQPWHSGSMHEAFLILSALPYHVGCCFSFWGFLSTYPCAPQRQRLSCPSVAGGGSGHDQVVRQAAGQPGLRVASGRTCSAGTCCTTRAGWTWMTWRWWMWKTGRIVTST